MEIAQFNPFITRNRLARAARLIGALDTLEADAETRLRFAEQLSYEDWAGKVAVVADHQADQTGDPSNRFEARPPSTETIAMAIGILQSRRVDEQMTDVADDVFAGWGTH